MVVRGSDESVTSVLVLSSHIQDIDSPKETFPWVLPEHAHASRPLVELCAAEEARIARPPFIVQLLEARVSVQVEVVVQPSSSHPILHVLRLELRVGPVLAGRGLIGRSGVPRPPIQMGRCLSQEDNAGRVVQSSRVLFGRFWIDRRCRGGEDGMAVPQKRLANGQSV